MHFASWILYYIRRISGLFGLSSQNGTIILACCSHFRVAPGRVRNEPMRVRCKTVDRSCLEFRFTKLFAGLTSALAFPNFSRHTTGVISASDPRIPEIFYKSCSNSLLGWIVARAALAAMTRGGTARSKPEKCQPLPP